MRAGVDRLRGGGRGKREDSGDRADAKSQSCTSVDVDSRVKINGDKGFSLVQVVEEERSPLIAGAKNPKNDQCISRTVSKISQA